MSLIRRLLICCRVLFRTGQAPSGTVGKLDTWLDAQRQRKHAASLLHGNLSTLLMTIASRRLMAPSFRKYQR